MKSILSLVLACCAALLAGCESVPNGPPPPVANLTPAFAPVAPVHTAPLDPSLLRSADTAFTLGPGDVMEIEYIGEPTSRATVRVGPDGKIYYYLLPGLDVEGLTLAQARQLISQQSEKYLRRNPAVAITLRVVASQRVWVLGQLNTPGVFPIAAPTTLLEAIAQAGGPTAPAPAAGIGIIGESADLRHSFVMRKGQLLPVDFEKLIHDGDPQQNIYLQPGDFIYVAPSLAQTVHVIGAVSNPRTVTSGSLTLIQAISSAGGTIDDAYLTHVAIVRGSLSRPSIAVVNYLAILKGEQPDVVLEPHDIVYVPFTPYQALERYADLILQTFVRTVGVNEGSRAVDPSAGSVSVNVGVAP